MGPGRRGCIQRVKAINVFLYDIYHDQEIIKAGLVPRDLVLLNPAFRPEMMGIEPPNNVYAHIAGIDLIRTGERDFFVLGIMSARRRVSPTCWRTARS